MTEETLKAIHTIVRDAYTGAINNIRARFGWANDVRAEAGDAFVVGTAVLHSTSGRVNTEPLAHFARLQVLMAFDADENADATLVQTGTAVALASAAIHVLRESNLSTLQIVEFIAGIIAKGERNCASCPPASDEPRGVN